MARHRNAPASQAQSAASKEPERKALREKTNTTRAKAAAVFSEPVDGFVKDARPTRGRAKKAAQESDDLAMAGGLGQNSDAPPSEVPMTTDELAKSDGVAPPTVKANKRPPRQARKPVQSEAQSKVFDDMKKRMRVTAQQQAGSKANDSMRLYETATSSDAALPTKPASRKSDATVERSAYSISPSPPPPGKLTSVKNKRSSSAQPGSVLKSQSTPAPETSILALKNFKRRPRQPSMLAMVQQRTISARPSAVQAQADDLDDPSVFDIDGSDEAEDDFAPDAEGTPLHLRVAKRTSMASERKAPSSKKRAATEQSARPVKKRRSDDIESSTSSLSALRARRQPAATPDLPVLPTEDHVPATLDQRTSSARQGTPQPQIMSEVQVINSSPSTTPPTEPSPSDYRQKSFDADVVVPSTEEEAESTVIKASMNREALPQDVNEADNGTMAEPASSSPTPEDPIATQSTNIMAEPLTQITPPRPKAQKEKKAKPMMTSTLQSLLPKRRQPLQPRHRKSEYDIETDSEEDQANADSGSEVDVGTRRRQTKTATSKRGKPTANPQATKTAPTRGRKSAAPPPSRKTTAATSRKRSTATAKNAKGSTYGRKGQSDKENEGENSDFEELPDNDDSALPDTSMSMAQVDQSGELAKVRAKFAEVDEWDMEFESVSFEEGRSSSQNWR